MLNVESHSALPFTIHHSPFTIHHSPFTIQHSTFNIQHSPYPSPLNRTSQPSQTWGSRPVELPRSVAAAEGGRARSLLDHGGAGEDRVRVDHLIVLADAE